MAEKKERDTPFHGEAAISNPKTSPGCSIAIASVVALVGVFIMLVSLNVIPVNPATFHAPRLVLARAGMVFRVTGGRIAIRVISPDTQDARLSPWMQSILLLGFRMAFVSIYLGLGLWPGERQFGMGTNPGTANPLPGRLFAAASGGLAALGAASGTVLQARRLLGRQAARKPGPTQFPDSGSDRNGQA